MSAKAILLGAFVLVLTATAAANVSAKGVKDSAGRPRATVSRAAFRPVIEFGHRGGNLRPYRIGIDASGRVKILQGRPPLKADSVPAEKVEELLREASDAQFWKTTAEDDAAAQKILPDFGFVFVRVRTADGRRINHQGRASGPLGKLFDQLAELILA